MEMVCISFEAVVTGLTLMYLFHLQQMAQADDKEIALAFLSLAATLAAMAAAAIGAGPMLQAARATWTHVTRISLGASSAGGRLSNSRFDTRLGAVVPVGSSEEGDIEDCRFLNVACQGHDDLDP